MSINIMSHFVSGSVAALLGSGLTYALLAEGEEDHGEQIPRIHDLKLNRLAESLPQGSRQRSHRFHARPTLLKDGFSS